MSLQGKVAIVTGAGQGLGKAIAARLAREGAKVAVAEMNPETREAVAAEIKAAGGQAIAIQTDVTKAGSIDRLLTETKKAFGRMDILVNNAGLGQNIMPSVELSEEEWQRVMAVNITGVFLCCKAVAKVFMAQESGRIINLSSINGLHPAPLALAYNVSKAGVISLTKTFAYELAPYNVTVNAICPGPVYTDFNRKVMSQRAEILGITLEEMKERIRASIPIGRWLEPEDIANMVVFFAQDESCGVTGEVISVSGGLSGVSGVVPKRK